MLTDEEIKIIYDEYEREIDAGHTVNGFARAIERAVMKKLGELDGWQLVPIEPTPEMLDAGVAMSLQVSVHGQGGWSRYLGGLYKQMLSAAQKP